MTEYTKTTVIGSARLVVGYNETYIAGPNNLCIYLDDLLPEEAAPPDTNTRQGYFEFTVSFIPENL